MAHERRVFVELPSEINLALGAEVSLSNTDTHHIKNVLRLKTGNVLVAVSRHNGQEFEAVVSDLADPVRIKIISQKVALPFTSRLGSVCMALLKGKRNDILCDQLTELGAENIVFWQAERSIVKIKSAKDATSKLERWSKISETAAKQSGQTKIARLFYAENLAQTLKIIRDLSSPADLALVCSLSNQAKKITELEFPSGRVHLIIGPEGDFSSKEEELLKSGSLKYLSLGQLRLRAETAALVASAVVQTIWGEAKA